MTQETVRKNDFRDEALLYLDALWQTALWFAENERDAENLVMDTYIEASRIWDGDVSNADCKTRIFKVLMKMLFGNMRLNFRAHIPGNFENIYESFPSDKISAIETIPKDVVIRAIRSLPVENRLVIVLSTFERFSYSEIAEMIGIHRRTVRLIAYQGYMLIQMELLFFFAESPKKYRLAESCNSNAKGGGV